MTWAVPPEWDGERADKVLARVAEVSRTAARAALESGDVVVDGEPVEPRTKVGEGAVFTGVIPEITQPLEPEPIAFEVPYEDDDVAVIEKPTGLVTHPGAGNSGGTLASGLLYRWPHIRGVGAEDRWGIVHRLDRDTSGLLVVALTADAYIGLSEAIKRRDVMRQYLALVAGRPETATGTVEAPLGRDLRRPTRFRIDPDGRSAVTHYRIESEYEHTTLLRLTLETGRTHQIRVHLSSIGLPVAGDATYGRPNLSSRLFLHATRLRFEHPVTGVTVDIESSLPDDLVAVLAGQ
jgi:23S rRNA pseudouridine1911/1915/1917 synthase